jgi:hypothetical protein
LLRFTTSSLFAPTICSFQCCREHMMS